MSTADDAMEACLPLRETISLGGACLGLPTTRHGVATKVPSNRVGTANPRALFTLRVLGSNRLPATAQVDQSLIWNIIQALTRLGQANMVYERFDESEGTPPAEGTCVARSCVI